VAISIVLAQINPTVGAIEKNARAAADIIRKARDMNFDLVVFPEMVVTGYPTNDLLFEHGFVAENERVVDELILPHTRDIAVILGCVRSEPGRRITPDEPCLRNCAAVLAGGKWIAQVNKALLPNYDVFDEKRYFIPAAESAIAPVDIPIRDRTLKTGVQICEDLWDEHYSTKVTKLLCERGAELIVNISASPFYVGKNREREELVRAAVVEHKRPFVYCNMVGGQDELVFDGRSFVMGADARVMARAAAFEQEICVVELDTDTWSGPEAPEPPYSREQDILNAHILNLRDYFFKQGIFKGITVGLSGGVDSAYTAFVAAQAIGPENVLCVAMPSQFTSQQSLDDAEQCARNIGAQYKVVSIKEMFEQGVASFARAFGETPFGLAEENDQSRFRMIVLMKISQKFGYMVCTTGNKSEISTGYFTMFGDGSGGKNVPGDLYKTELYQVVRHINREREIIPQSIIDKPPTAELRENQKDTDSLPPYPELDPVIKLVVEGHLSKAQIVERGYSRELVDKVYGLYKKSEFKRGQLPLGIKISKKAYGAGRRIPITNQWQG